MADKIALVAYETGELLQPAPGVKPRTLKAWETAPDGKRFRTDHDERDDEGRVHRVVTMLGQQMSYGEVTPVLVDVHAFTNDDPEDFFAKIGESVVTGL